MRLIDADALETVMTEDWFLEILATQDSKSAIKKYIVNCIDNMPTAYNPKKVLVELEEYKYSHLVEHDSERYEHCKEEEINCDGRDCFLCVWDKAIEIVRKGGVE